MELAPLSLLYEETCPEKLKDDVTKKIREFYLGDKNIDESTKSDLIDVSICYKFSDFSVEAHPLRIKTIDVIIVTIRI